MSASQITTNFLGLIITGLGEQALSFDPERTDVSRRLHRSPGSAAPGAQLRCALRSALDAASTDKLRSRPPSLCALARLRAEPA
jgi:hypothetical protein